MSELYKKLYELSFEIESLLLNLTSKDDECLKRMKPLLDEKVGEFNALYSALDVETVSEEKPDKSLTEVESESEQTHCSETTDEIQITEDEPHIDVVDLVTTATPDTDEEISEAEIVPAVPVPAVQQEIPVEKKIKPRKPITHYFTLNDRFLYTRELFGGSNEQYNQAISLIESMPDAQFAKDYFISELGLDEADTTVLQFLDAIERYFKE